MSDTTVDVVTINGVEYRRAGTEPPPADSEAAIVVLTNRWVLVGLLDFDGNTLLANAHVVREWGTSKGLGELVNGPTRNTILDPLGNVSYNVDQVLFTLPVHRDAWAHQLG